MEFQSENLSILGTVQFATTMSTLDQNKLEPGYEGTYSRHPNKPTLPNKHTPE